MKAGHPESKKPRAAAGPGQDPYKVLIPNSPRLRNVDAVVDCVLAENVGNCMSLGMFIHLIAAITGAAGEQLRTSVIDHLHNVLSARLMVAGDVDHINHVPWPCTPDEALEKVLARTGPEPDMDYEAMRDICWLANTSYGNHRAAHRYITPTAGTASDRLMVKKTP